MSPLSLSVQRKQKKDAESLYNKIKECLEKGNTRLLELSCDQLVDKKITVVSNEILAVQIYEKTASIGGSKRPGFSLND